MFKKQILDNQKLISEINIIKRDYEFYYDLLKINKIVSFVGPRRIGKTFLMLSFIKELIENNKIQLQQVVFLDFSLNNSEDVDYSQIISSFKELYPELQPFFVFDEIQDVPNFKEIVLSLYNLGYKIFITGSNSKLLSSELSTHFRGRVFEYKVFPLTFKEVLRFKNIEYKKNLNSSELGMINNILLEILKFGAFPEIVLSNNDLFKIDNLKTYFDIMIYKDLMERYNIVNETSLKYMIKSLTIGFTKNTNINKIYNELKSLNIKIGKTTLYEYYEYIKNIFYIYELNNFYNKKTSKKGFLYNIGFNYLFGNAENLGQSFENIVFLELIKKYEKVFFKKNFQEIDFYLPEQKINIQVCFDLNKDNYKRESSPLLLKNVNERNFLLYFKKGKNINEGENFELISFYDFISNDF